MKINLQGQLATAAESSQIDFPLTQDTTVEEVITNIAADLPSAARELLINSDGSPRTSLFIALNNNHLRALSTVIHHNTDCELTLMPPMAGG